MTILSSSYTWFALALMCLVVSPACGQSGGRSPGDVAAVAERGGIDVVSSGSDSGSWSPLTVLTVVDPRHHGAVGDGTADDTEGLQAALDTLVDGGILLFDEGTSYRTTDVLRIGGDHVKLWSPDGDSGVLADTAGRSRRQAIVVDGGSNVGLFGLRLDSTADRRLSALEDSAVVLDGADHTEIIGLEITNSASAAVMAFGASELTFVTGNTIHHNWADGVHFTDGARGAWVWNNLLFTEEPWLGDDGIACVTYGSGPRCRDMEWWDNIHLGSGWGRGLAVVGGDDIDIHDNVVQGTGAAGILVASEPSFDTSGSNGITIRNNTIVDVGHAVPHPAVLVSAMAEPINDVMVSNNTIVVAGERAAFTAEGDVHDVQHLDSALFDSTDDADLVYERKFRVAPRGQSILATRDAVLVAEQYRRGLYRIQVRRAADGIGFEQRFEYVLRGKRSDLDRWRAEPDLSSTSFCRPPNFETVTTCVLVARTRVPMVVPAEIGAVPFAELRAMAGEYPELWDHLDAF